MEFVPGSSHLFFPRYIHLIASISISLLLITNIALYRWYRFCFHLSVDGHLGYFYLLATRIIFLQMFNVQVFVWMYILILRYVLRSGIAKLYGNSIHNIFRNCQTVFLSSYTILYSYQKSMKGAICPHPQQGLF